MTTIEDDISQRENEWLEGCDKASFIYMPRRILEMRLRPIEHSAWLFIGVMAESFPLPEGKTGATAKSISSHLKISVAESFIILAALERRVMIEVSRGRIEMLPYTEWRM